MSTKKCNKETDRLHIRRLIYRKHKQNVSDSEEKEADEEEVRTMIVAVT